jgi:hypothetical protein
MSSYPRMTLRVAAAAGLVAMLCGAQASATEGVVAESVQIATDATVVAPAAAVAVEATTAPASVGATSGAELSSARAMASAALPVTRRQRAAAHRPYRQVAANSYGPRCSDGWCGRQSFAIMLGIGF